MDYGLIGEKLTHSFSKEIHTLLGNDNYQLCPVAENDFDTFMNNKDFKGINVTIPYKKAVRSYCNYVSAEADSIGSINTVINKDGVLFGYNTDYYGMRYSFLKAGISFRNKKVVILGSGGTSLTAVSVASDLGAGMISVISRTGDDNYDNISKHSDCDILINTTPVGMYPDNDGIPLNLDIFKKLEFVFDVIYNPINTALTLEAEKRNIKNMNGLLMLVSQAKYSDELFFDRKTDISLCDSIYDKLYLQRENIILSGMSGTGKSTIGEAIARKTGKQFVDTDNIIETDSGMSIENIFSKYGEDYFRRLESETVKKIAAKTGLVISLGGGAVLFEDNYKRLKQNGKIYYIERTPESIDIKGRPLTPDRESLQKLFEKRRPLYLENCDYKVDNESTPDLCADKIISLSKENLL